MLKKIGGSLIIFLLSSVLAFAASLRIDQPKVRLSIPAGGVKTGTIKVENISDEPITVKVYLEDWYYIEPFDGSKEFKPAGALPSSCAKWITLMPSELSIPAFSSKTVNFTVNVPPDARGGHYAVMFFESQAGKKEEVQGVMVNVVGRIGSLFYVEPEGTINKACSLDNLSLNMDPLNKALEIAADFQNLGNTYINAKGNYYLIDQQGVVYARGEFNEIYTFPQDKVKIKSSWKDVLPQGRYDIVITLNLGGRDSLVREAGIRIAGDGEVIAVGKLK